jgi:anaerobic selenocysteine-containing dehydrogenase
VLLHLAPAEAVATGGDGSQVEVTPVFQLLKERLADYEPEKAAALCGVNPGVIRMLAQKVARKRTNILLGFNAGKYYHGDLMERSMCLLLALTGNWGKKGTHPQLVSGYIRQTTFPL